MRLHILAVMLGLRSSLAIPESQVFAKNFCRAALASDIAFCNSEIGECSIRSSYADTRPLRGESRIPCTSRFLVHMEKRFSSYVEQLFPSYTHPRTRVVLATVDGSPAIPFEEVFSSYSKFLATDLSNILLPQHFFRDSSKMLKLIEMRIFCPSSTWFNNGNMSVSNGDFEELMSYIESFPILTSETWDSISMIATRGNLPQALTRNIGEYLGHTIQSKNLLTDDVRFSYMHSVSGQVPLRPIRNDLIVSMHEIVSRLIVDARFESTAAFLEICVQRVLNMLGSSRGRSPESTLEILQRVNERDKVEKILPARLMRAFYHIATSLNIGQVIGATKPELLSHHMLTSTYPNQHFVSEFVEGVLLQYGPIPEGLPSKVEVESFLSSIAGRIESESLRCVIETVVLNIATKSGVGKITPFFCRRALTEISASSLFDGITELMHHTTIESYMTFHRMFRHIPVMGMIREILEQVGYHFATTQLSQTPFHDERMVYVYTAFMKACSSLESTAKQYHIMFGGRRGEMSGW